MHQAVQSASSAQLSYCHHQSCEHRVIWILILSLLRDRKVILHTDSAKSYQAQASWGPARQGGSLQKASEGQRDMAVATPPLCADRHPQVAPALTGRPSRSNPGTQIIDRCWRFLKERVLVNQHTKAGSSLLRAKLRSAQYETGTEMLTFG